MNNQPDDNNKQETKEEQEQINIDIENLDELSSEELMEILSQLSGDNNLSKKERFIQNLKSFVLFLCQDLIISILLVFMLNYFLNIINTKFVNFLIFFGIYYGIDLIFNYYFNHRFPFLKLISFGIINFIITFLAFIISGIICKQFIVIKFADFILVIIGCVIYTLIKNFVFRYINKLWKKGKKNDSIN